MAVAPIATLTRTWPGPADPYITLPRMVHVVLREYTQPPVVDTAVAIAASTREKDPQAIAGALMDWLRVHTRFVEDPINLQLLKSPLEMLRIMQRDGIAGGDCVDVAMLSAALAMAVGLHAEFVAEAYPAPGADGLKPKLSHVYTIVQTQGDLWLNMDTQRPPTLVDTGAAYQVNVTIP